MFSNMPISRVICLLFSVKQNTKITTTSANTITPWNKKYFLKKHLKVRKSNQIKETFTKLLPRVIHDARCWWLKKIYSTYTCLYHGSRECWEEYPCLHPLPHTGELGLTFEGRQISTQVIMEQSKDFPVVWWLRLHGFNADDMGSILGQETDYTRHMICPKNLKGVLWRSVP